MWLLTTRERSKQLSRQRIAWTSEDCTADIIQVCDINTGKVEYTGQLSKTRNPEKVVYMYP